MWFSVDLANFNLTSVNVVVVFDPQWNQTDDTLAHSNHFRLAQRRDVTVFKLVTSGSIEETLYLRQAYKQVRIFLQNNECMFTVSAWRVQQTRSFHIYSFISRWKCSNISCRNNHRRLSVLTSLDFVLISTKTNSFLWNIFFTSKKTTLVALFPMYCWRHHRLRQTLEKSSRTFGKETTFPTCFTPFINFFANNRKSRLRHQFYCCCKNCLVLYLSLNRCLPEPMQATPEVPNIDQSVNIECDVTVEEHVSIEGFLKFTGVTEMSSMFASLDTLLITDVTSHDEKSPEITTAPSTSRRQLRSTAHTCSIHDVSISSDDVAHVSEKPADRKRVARKRKSNDVTTVSDVCCKLNLVLQDFVVKRCCRPNSTFLSTSLVISAKTGASFAPTIRPNSRREERIQNKSERGHSKRNQNSECYPSINKVGFTWMNYYFISLLKTSKSLV